MKISLRAGALIAVGLLAGCDSEPEIDAATLERGERLAEGCEACHALYTPEQRVGPSLLGIVGRPAASLPDYDYSSALRGSGLVWDAFTIEAFIANPQAVVPDTKMVGNSLSPGEAAEVVKYLETIE